MIDPHIEKLHYKVVTKDDTDYDKAAPLEEEADDFVMTLQGDKAVFVMKEHFSSEQDARVVIDEFLKRWDILIGIEHGPDELKFIFERSDVIDRAPAPENGTGHTIYCEGGQYHLILSECKDRLHVSRSKYPTLPRQFVLSPDAETMYVRYKAYKENREPLLSMAYFCLTVLESSAGNRRSAAWQYHIQKDVLEKLGDISSNMGNRDEIRKLSKKGLLKPLSGAESTWVEAVIKLLIRRAGEWAYDSTANLKEIRMADLPNVAVSKET